jgi:type II secretory pathway component GspD/PulD (secretin)
MKQRQFKVIGRATLSSLLLVALLGPIIAATQIFGGEAETSAKGNPAAKADFVLTVKDNLVSLTAKDASLKEVLEEIGRKMNIEVFALLSEQEKTTVGFEKLPLKEAIERLIRNYPHLVVSQEGDGRITRIIALQKNRDAMPSKPVVKETETKKKGTPVMLESRMKEQALRQESKPTEPFRFQFDPSQYRQKRQ